MADKVGGFRFVVFRVLVLVLFSGVIDDGKGKSEAKSSNGMPSVVNIGVVRVVGSDFDMMISACIERAILDFYSMNPMHETRLEVRFKDVNDTLDLDLAVLELLEQGQVQAIFLPNGPTDEIFVAHLARRFQIPIISLAPGGSPPPEAQNPYFVSASADDAAQSRALAAVFRDFGWKRIVALYEDAEFGYRFLSRLSESLGDAGIGLAHLTSLPASSDETRLRLGLTSLNESQAVKVFLLHASAPLGFRLLRLAEKLGMMREGYAWIVTDAISNFMSSADHETRGSMQGVLGVRPSFPLPDQNFEKRLKISNAMGLNFYGLRAYDMVTALARSPLLSQELSLRGSSGAFELVNGTVKASGFDIFTVVGNGERKLKQWTPEKGLKDLGKVVSWWPGDSANRPKGSWATPSGILRVGVPCNSNAKDFVSVSGFINHETEVNATGFAVDIFLAAMGKLPTPVEHRFFCFGDMDTTKWNYDDMLRAMPAQKYDIVVADTTIWAPRTSFVDFSQPYLESGMLLVVRRNTLDKWFFTSPLKWDMWLAILVSSMLMGLVIRIIERRTRSPGQEVSMTRTRISTTFLVPITVLAFQERNMVTNKWSAFVLVCWVFMAFVLMQSFQANLSAILTIDRLYALNSGDYSLGYRARSFTKNFLTKNLNIDESRLKPYSTDEEFHDAMSRGSKNGGIDAIFDEIPYMNLFMKKYESKYKIMGPTYPADGLGFAFPLGSPLVADFSRTILIVNDNGSRFHSENKHFEAGITSPLELSTETHRLTFDDFSVIFMILASAAAFALICSEFASLRDTARRLVNMGTGRADVGSITGSGEAENGEWADGGERESGGEREEDGEEIFEDALSNVGDDVGEESETQ